ncbi:mannose-1-phosphate guanylyltransferase [Amycolatopsis sp. NPDC059021]|uniref:mannose-1-phosphate guanylyltransferase n=1 Tax=Amycolatopsis sp. NPDC059021 TaxID=3346704 RepID=UPI00366C96F8
MPGPLDLYAVVPAGGSGTRLWPLSRANHPKFFQPLTGTRRSLLQATFDRLTPLVGAGHVYVVTGTAHAAGVGRQLPDVPENNILVEPSPRDSCAAIALAAAVIERRRPGAIMGSFAADHLIKDEPVFRRTITEATEGAADGVLMTVGITPTRAETGYGYVECTEQVRPSTIQPVLKFREKPPYELAVEFVESGKYLWNASTFVWRTDVFLARLAEYRPDIAEPIQRIAAAWDGPDAEQVLADVWPTVPRIAVEYAVMEPAAAEGKVATIPGDFGWSDIGDFETVAETLGSPRQGAMVADITDTADPKVVTFESDGLIVVPGGDRLVATLGVRDLIVVDTEDAVLICARDRAQDIKELTSLVREQAGESYV